LATSVRTPLEIEVLGDVVIGAVPHRLDRHLELLGDGDHDDFDVRIVLFGDLEDFKAADAGKAHVEEHQLDVFLVHHLQRRFAGRDAQDAVVGFENRRQRIPHPFIVIDDKKCFSALGHAGAEYSRPTSPSLTLPEGRGTLDRAL
jgi:hypothetical protein